MRLVWRPPSIRPAVSDKLARERSEDRERTLLTSKATAQSAEMLSKLVQNAEQLMVKLAQRDESSRRDFKKQVVIALVSLVVGAAFAGGALVYAKLAYEHDLAKDTADDVAAKAAAARDDRIVKALEQNALLLQLNQQLARDVQQLTKDRPTAVTRSASSSKRP